MSRMGRMTMLAATLILVGAACGSSKNSGNAKSTTATTAATAAQGGNSYNGAYGAGGGQSTTPSAGTVVSTATDPKLGKILVDGTGRTLYLFEVDSGTTSACTGSCATTWLALTASGTPGAGAGIDQSKLTTAMQTGGANQVVYSGHLLYQYSGDTGPGMTNGEGIRGLWFAVTPDGQPAKG